MPKLSFEDSSRLIGHLQANVPVAEVAKSFNVTLATVYSLKKKFERHGTVKRLAGSGRPRKTSKAIDDQIKEAHDSDRFKTSVETADEFNLSAKTVRRRLAERGLNARRPAVKPRLTAEHKQLRLKWAKKYRRFTWEDWKKVIFSDETSFSVSQTGRGSWCYRYKNERYQENTILEKINRGYGCVSVWGAIINNVKFPLVRIDGRLNKEIYVTDIPGVRLLSPDFNKLPNLQFLSNADLCYIFGIVYNSHFMH